MEKQAEAIGLPIHFISLESDSYQEYEDKMNDYFRQLKTNKIEYVIYGDIFLEDLKNYRNAQLKKHGLKGVYPLWKQNTKQVVSEFIEKQFKTLVCAINLQKLPEQFLGKSVDEKFLKILPKEVDYCGENGEFHTFCFDGPIFQKPLQIKTGKIHIVNYYLGQKEIKTGFIDLLLS
jgi:uncharacterized protein (TIGR00290 family)